MYVEPAKAWAHASGKNFANVDGAIMMAHITLCAAEFGLGACRIVAFDIAKVKSALHLSAGVEPLALTPLGKPNDVGCLKTRKPLAEIIHHERW